MTEQSAFCVAIGRGAVGPELLTVPAVAELRRRPWFDEQCETVLFARLVLAELARECSIHNFAKCFMASGFSIPEAVELAVNIASPAAAGSAEVAQARAWLLEQIRGAA